MEVDINMIYRKEHICLIENMIKIFFIITKYRRIDTIKLLINL